MLRAVGCPLTIEEVAIGKPKPNELLIRTKAVSLCHSDLQFMEGLGDVALPAILGHESAGVVEEVGENVRTVKVGDHVITCLSMFCGHCEHCLNGFPARCERTR